MRPLFGNAANEAGNVWRLSVVSAMIFLGCSTTTVIRRDQDLFLEKPGTLITRDGTNINVRHTLIRNDSISGIDSRLGRKIQMPVAEAQKLVIGNRAQAAWQGMLIFAGVGAVIGAIPDPECGDTCLFPNGGLNGSLFWAVLAAPAGAFWGAVLGNTRNYVFEQSSPIDGNPPHPGLE
jgi:hypothetical protein